MSTGVPSVLILGHSFVKRLERDLRSHFDHRAHSHFKLEGTVSVHLHGVGGRTVAKLRSFDLRVVEQIAPDILILEIGTNDLVDTSPEVVGSEIESLVCLLVEKYKVRVVCVCHVIPRGHSHHEAASFSARVEVLQQYLDVVLSSIPNVFVGSIAFFLTPGKIYIYLMAFTLIQRVSTIYIVVTGAPFCGHCVCFDIFRLHFWNFHTFPTPNFWFSHGVDMMCPVLILLFWGFVLSIIAFLAGSLILLFCVRILPPLFY